MLQGQHYLTEFPQLFAAAGLQLSLCPVYNQPQDTYRKSDSKTKSLEEPLTNNRGRH